jgi:hypothetical protein
MRIPGGHLLATLRRRRQRVVAALLPALLLSFATGSSCLAMSMGHGMGTPSSDQQPTQAAPMGHMAHHDDPAARPAHAPNEPTCPHCQTADQPTAASHSACGASDVSATGGPFAKYSAADVRLPVLTSWVPLPLTPAPPLIRAAAPRRGASASEVPLSIRHCVLLI